MAGRNPVETGMGIRLRPTTSPVDTFERSDAGSGLSQIAQGLATINPALGRFSEVLVNRSIEENTRRGQEAARRMVEEGKTLKGLMAKGDIYSHENPWFMKGFYELAGQQASNDWNTDFTVKVKQAEKDGLIKSMDDFDSFLQEHRATWTEENVGRNYRNGAFEVGFGPTADAHWANQRQAFASRLDRAVLTADDQTIHGAIKGLIRDNIGIMDQGTLASEVGYIVDSAVGRGRKESQVSSVAMKAIVAAAMESDEFGIQALDLLGKIKGEAGVFLRDTTYGSDAYTKAKQTISERIFTNAERSHRAREREREERTRGILGQAMKARAEDPNADLSGMLPQIMDNPMAAGMLRQLMTDVASVTDTTDPATQKNLFSRIWSDMPGLSEVDETEIIQARLSKKLTHDDAYQLITMLQNVRSTGGRGKGVYDDKLFRFELNNLDDRFMSIYGNKTGELGDSKAYAAAMLTERWATLNSSGRRAQMKDEEIIQWLTNNAADVVLKQRPKGFSLQPARAPEFQSVQDIETRLKGQGRTTTPLKQEDFKYSFGGVPSQSLYDYLKANNLRTPTEIGAALIFESKLYEAQFGTNPLNSEPKPKAPVEEPKKE